MSLKGHYSNRRKKERIYRIILFVSIFTIITMLGVILYRPPAMEDYSGGVYKKTFETGYKPLRQELKLLKKEGFFQVPPEPLTPVPTVFTEWYHALPVNFSAAAFSELEQITDLSLKAAVQQKNLYFPEPLENSVPPDLFLSLEQCFAYRLGKRDYKRASAALERMFCFSSLMLNSNAPDVYFLEKSVSCAKLYETVFRENARALSGWEKSRSKIIESYIFPYQNLYLFERLRVMRDFEKIRQNGLSLFYGKTSAGTLMKEGFRTVSFSLIMEGFRTLFTDLFYDPDRDQKMNLELIRALLYQGITPKTAAQPNRPISFLSHRRMSRDADILSASLEYLEKKTE